ncbi:MAG: AAA family ATPase [Isosphaeraceae bacterium]
MKNNTRIVLVDPQARTRQELQKQLGSLSEADLVEVCPAYQMAVRRIAALTPDLVLVVVDDDLVQSLELIETITSGFPGVAILPAGALNDGGLILRVIRAGAREFLPLPTTALEMFEAIRRLCPRQQRTVSGPRGPQFIAVTGAAGGVGCSTLAVNLATTLTKLSRRDSLLADFDLLLGSLEECLAVIPDNSLEVVVRNIDELDPTLLKRWLPRHTSGLYVLPHPVSMEESARLDPDAMRRVLQLMKESFDTVVIDTSKGLQTTDFLAFEMADVILVVIQLNLNCTRNSVRLLQYLHLFEGFAEKIRVVVNRVNSPLSEISVKKAEELLKTQIRWMIPNATKVIRPARTQGVPIDEVEGGAKCKAHEAILEIAQELLPYPLEPVQRRKGLFGAFRSVAR